MSKPVLLIISDRAFVWRGFRATNRTVRRWIGERAEDDPNPEAGFFTGDPTSPETYRCMIDHHNLSAVVDIQDAERAQGAIAALRQIRPEAAVLVITDKTELHAPEVAVSRRLEWTDALRGDLEAELSQLETQRRVLFLREFASADVVPILLHPDPDPDALAAALAMRELLRRPAEATPIITTDDMTRPENRRMAELLSMRVTVVTQAEVEQLERVIALDHQPEYLDSSEVEVAVIDHHPTEQEHDYAFADLRSDYGATATLLTEYLCADDDRRINEALATALLYGIMTDTDVLTRGVSPADVKAYAYLLGRADLSLLRKLERPSYKAESARAYGAALTHLGIKDDMAVVFLGRLPEEDTHMLVEMADFCIALEDITWAVAGAIIEDRLDITLRYLGGDVGAGDLANELAGSEGSGGGHKTMARARLPLNGEWKGFARAGIEHGTRKLLSCVSSALERLRANPQSSRPARPAKARPAASR